MSIVNAINNKNLISFYYEKKFRVGEPHVLGICKNKEQLLLWQTEGQTSSGRLPMWRRFDVDKIKNFEILETKFLGSRPPPSGEHAPFDTVIVVVK